MNMLPSILEACEYRMETTKLLNSYITEMAENSISERLIFKIFWGSMPPDPPTGKHWKRNSNFHPLPINLTVIMWLGMLHTVKLFSKLDENNDKWIMNIEWNF